MNTKQENVMGMGQEISKWKNRRVLNHPQNLARRLLASGTFHDPPQIILPSGLSLQVLVTVKVIVGWLSQQK